ncbi:undecaprenyldiphospho-muramoylpentapeptide beta-N-acetylglucosaminyltransferase [Nesterenkonia sp. E16_7]|uniref:undecaprenyldiphospho-muramoylpentapeptide beta-N-acetylglucosaminyltransferase n=1 Tax=unclassified Nesterenkonia TaxID=2629769 RepID=UPI001A92E089|nr:MULTISPECIES: undecaprenyldiphospho-muramoylpentapeptide beta-N-acetylglucosaminyltransferase [unclassified Nesterenkonia]MBO0595107.1 undecaprenyldiphospho-muramoylpentapeptide beta-N-acetylglucosaminyltransferase [Nesterenkonia sp. E16_10]MBO0598762.1 undecaprenyldiphospho-muramoylpentapeptide beta-N-acetylglucosaminyltransferase [Nesterenkonia sp. E16_7]
MNELSIVLAGGGTAGHVSPMLAVARALDRLAPEVRQTVIGTAAGLETRLVPEAGYRLETIEKVPMPRRPSRNMLRFPSRFGQAVRDAAGILRAEQADVVMGVGGYVCTPVFVAARRLGIPVVIHEANARPGLANKLGHRFAAFTGVAFENTPLKGSEWVGMPMSREISQLDRAKQRGPAREALGLDPEKVTLVVTGGSSGALSLNLSIKAALTELLGTGAQVLHLTGRDKALTGEHGALLEHPGYHQREYLDGMELAYAAADLIIARAGAATVSEIAAVGLPAIFVPLPVGNGEQELNARELVAAGGALLVKDEHFNRSWIRRNMVPLLEDPRLLANMEQQSAARGITDADDRMARATLAAAGHPISTSETEK